MDNLLTGSLDNIAHIQDPGFIFVEYDVTNFISINGEPDFVLHLPTPASPIDYPSCPSRPSRWAPSEPIARSGWPRPAVAASSSPPPPRSMAILSCIRSARTIGET